VRKLTTLAWWQFVPVLERREAFRTDGALSGGQRVWRFGRLAYDYRENVKSADYVVLSYSTPIAWHVPTGAAQRLYLPMVLGMMANYRDADGYWIQPEEHYSLAACRHQGLIAMAISQLVSEQRADLRRAS